MVICFAGQIEAGSEELAELAANLFPMYRFTAASYEEGQSSQGLSTSDAVVIAVNLMEGPMPGTRAAISDCRKQNKPVVGFCLTREDQFDAQTGYGPHIKELVGIEARELASTYGFSDDAIPSQRIAINNRESLITYLEKVLGYTNNKFHCVGEN